VHSGILSICIILDVGTGQSRTFSDYHLSAASPICLEGGNPLPQRMETLRRVWAGREVNRDLGNAEFRERFLQAWLKDSSGSKEMLDFLKPIFFWCFSNVFG
jgi:hypothetical protein